MRHTQRGMTLVELLVTVGIVGILAAIAYPNYRQYALRGNRTEAKAELMEVAQELEKCYTRFGRYESANCVTYADLIDGTPRPSEGRRYMISFQSVARDTYQLQAVPQAGQVADTACANLLVDQSGRRSVSATAPDPKCW